MNADIGMQEQCQLMDIYKRLRVYVMMRLTKSCLLIPGVGDFTSFLSTETGFGNVHYTKGKATVKVVYGAIPVKEVVIENAS